MKEATELRYVIIPTYAEVFEELANGFGLAQSPTKKLSSQRSWYYKQGRYAPKAPPPVKRGLLGELLGLLSGGDSKLSNELHGYFEHYECLLSYLRGRALFSRQSYRYGLDNFLSLWVFPQIAIILWRGKGRFEPSSPLFYLPGLLPSIQAHEYDILSAVKRTVNAQLEAVGDIAAAAEFRNAINKLDVRSDKKLITIEKEIAALKDEMRGKVDPALLDSTVRNVHAAYVAGMAVKRFLGHLNKNFPSNATAKFCGQIRYYYDALDVPETLPDAYPFIGVHLNLFQELMTEDDLFAVSANRSESPFHRLVDCFEKAVDCIVLSECLPLKSLMGLFNNYHVFPIQVSAALYEFEQHQDYPILRPFADYAKAHFALAKSDLHEALALFKQVLDYTSQQQLGDVAALAAANAIVLEIITRSRWINGCLDPLVLHLIKAKKQALDLVIEHPTPFATFSRTPDLTTSTLLIMDAIREFNVKPYTIVEGGERVYCNPFASFNDKMGTFFSIFDRELSSQHMDRRTAIQEAMSRTFNQTAKTRTTLRFHTVSPYETLRDIWFYYPKMFEGSDKIFSSLNPHLLRYIGLPVSDQHEILHALDAVAYKADVRLYSETK